MFRGVGVEFGFEASVSPSDVTTDVFGPSVPGQPVSTQPVQPKPQTFVTSDLYQTEEPLIVDDEDVPVVVGTAPPPRKQLHQYCDNPGNLCFTDPVLGQSVRRAMVAGCESLRRAAELQSSVLGLGSRGLGVACGAPYTTRIGPKDYHAFLDAYGPCVLKDVPDCAIPFVPCPLNPNTCIDSEYQDVLDTAKTQCQFKVTPRGSSLRCPSADSVVTGATAHRFSPCELAKLKLCQVRGPEDWTPFNPELFLTPQDVSSEEEEEEGKYVIGGLLGLLILGGIAYAATRKRKKKGKRK